MYFSVNLLSFIELNIIKNSNTIKHKTSSRCSELSLEEKNSENKLKFFQNVTFSVCNVSNFG